MVQQTQSTPAKRQTQSTAKFEEDLEFNVMAIIHEQMPCMRMQRLMSHANEPPTNALAGAHWNDVFHFMTIGVRPQSAASCSEEQQLVTAFPCLETFKSSNIPCE